jgi:hypothetical protein
MKKTLQTIVGILGLILGLPIAFTLQYMVYKHIQATPVIWTLWIIQIPITITISIISEVLKGLDD